MSTNTITRQSCLDQLPPGSDPLVQELHLRATARDRHASRVAAAIAAARAYLPSGVPDTLVGALIDVELGGVGGPGGFAGGDQAATQRMSWAARLGKGRRNASDGPTWDAAFRAAIEQLCPGLLPKVEDLREMLPAIAEIDLEWPLAYALRAAYATREVPGLAATWADLAREVGRRCSWEGTAGKLATRYGLETQPPRHLGVARLRQETVAAVLGVEEHDLVEGPRRIGELEVTVRRDGHIDTTLTPEDPATSIHEPAWQLEISTLVPTAAIPLVTLAWLERWGVAEHDEIVALHAAMRPDLTPEARDRERDQWDAAAVEAAEDEDEDEDEDEPATLHTAMRLGLHVAMRQSLTPEELKDESDQWDAAAEAE